MPTTKDFLVKVKDLPEFDGLKLTPDNKLRIPDATINLGETAGGVATNTLNKDHFNLGSGTTTMLIEPNTFRMIKDIPADVEQETDAEYYKVEIDSVHQTFTIYDTDRITPIFQVTSSGLALGSSVITGITSQGGTSSTLAASQLLVNGKQNTLTAGSNIQIVNDVISAVLTEASNIIGTTDPQVGQGSPGVLYLKYEDVPSGSHVDPETGETVTDYTREIVNVYGNISGLWYEFPEGSLNLFGTTPPTADMGDNGSIYMQFNTVDGITQVYGKVNDTWYPFGGGGSVDPAIQKKVDELDETAIRTDAPLYTIDGEPLETISETQLEARGKNHIEDNVVVTQVQTSGTEIAQVKVGTHTTSIYAPSSGGGGSNVSITPALATGTKVADYTIDSVSGSLYAPTPQVIEANPSGTSTGTLNTIGIDNLVYDIAGGTNVVPNPSDAATEDLIKLQIGNDIYAITSGSYTSTALVPIMTSDTTPSGTVTASTYINANFAGYKAFDGNQCNISSMQGGWLCNQYDTTPTIQYTWGNNETRVCSELFIETANNGPTATKTVTIQGQLSDDTWENCLANGLSTDLTFTQGAYTEYKIKLNGHSYKSIKMTGSNAWYIFNSTACTISRMQVYEINAYVEGNPTGTATEDLSSIRIGNTIYDIPSSGGSGNIINDTLYTNPPDTLVSTITLSNPYTDYDILIFRTIRKADSHDNYLDKIYNVKDLNTGDYLQLLGWSASSNYYTCQITSNTVLTRINSGSNYNIYKIYGIKINGGGGGSSHNYSTTEHQVGTWIDGSIIYEQTFNLAGQYSVPSSGWGTTGITYNDYFNIIVEAEAVCQDSSSYYYIPCSATKASATGQLLVAGVTANQNRAIQYLTVRYTKPTS